MATSRKNVPVIGTLVNILQGKAAQKKGFTVPQLVERLHDRTGRKAKALEFTVRAQLSRLPKERKLKIVKVRDGQNVRYSAKPQKKAA